MPLNIGASGTIKPYAKYNSKADKWFAKGENGDVEIARPTFIADFPNIVTGWLMFREGQAPERVIDPSLDRAAPSPGEGFKRGFVLAVYSKNFFGGLAELSSASIHMGNAIREAYQVFEEQRGNHPGQLPVLACTGSDPMKDKYGTNYKPKIEVVKWVDRPAELPDERPVDDVDVWQNNSVPTKQVSGPVAPPPPVAQTAAPQAATQPASQQAATSSLAEAEF